MSMLLSDKNNNEENNEYKYNINDTNDKVTLTTIKHYLGAEFPPIPYLWHYDDFLQPFPVYGVKKISINKLKTFDIKINNINEFTDNNCDVYIIAQYKKEKFMYNDITKTNPNEVYISYHTWLFNNLTKLNEITNKKINFKFRFLTGIYPISGDYELYKHYPFKNDKKKSSGGIGIYSDKLEVRQATIHQHENHIKFSGINVCNFNIMSDNAVFLSIMKFPHIFVNDNKLFIKTRQGKSNCVVLHIFRNVYDNNPMNNQYQEIIEKYFN